MALIGERIKYVRKYKKITQKQLGKAIGMSEQAISQYERGERDISFKTLDKITKALDTNISFLVNDHYVNGDRVKSLINSNNLTIKTFADKLKVSEETINEFISNKKITTNSDQDLLYKVGDYFQVDDDYLLGETDFKYYEGEHINRMKSLIEDITLCKNDTIRITSSNILELIECTMFNTINGNKKKELNYLKEFYNIIYKLKNKLSNDAYIKCYGDNQKISTESIPLSNEDIQKLASSSKENFCNLVDNFVSYYTNLEEWRKDFSFDFDNFMERFPELNDIKTEK